MKLFRVVYIRNEIPVPDGLSLCDYVNVAADSAEMAKIVVAEASPWHSGVSVEEIADIHQIFTTLYPTTHGARFTETELEIRQRHTELMTVYRQSADTDRRAAVDATRNSAKASIE